MGSFVPSSEQKRRGPGTSQQAYKQAGSLYWPVLSPGPGPATLEHSEHCFAQQVSMTPQCSRAGLGLQKPVLMPGLAQTR